MAFIRKPSLYYSLDSLDVPLENEHIDFLFNNIINNCGNDIEKNG